jgi:hypothetical protein
MSPVFSDNKETDLVAYNPVFLTDADYSSLNDFIKRV